jgi:hypothetical protein
MLLAIGAIIVSISVLIIFVGNPASAQNIITDISWLGDITDSDDEETEDEETEDEETEDEETEPSESLTLEGLSPQGESDLAVACSMLPERC